MAISQQLGQLRAADVEAALQLLADGHETRFGESIKYDVLWHERRFAPKAVAGLALELMTGEVFGPGDFTGGVESACFNALQRLGYMIVLKSPDGVTAETAPLTLTRSQTPLSTAGEGITTRDGSVIAVQVQFEAHDGTPPAYKDQHLANGDILLIGRGQPEHGDQKETHGNRILVEAIERNSDDAFPVYEKIGGNRYHYLGDFIGSTFTYEELDPQQPGYKVFRFILTPVSAADLDSLTEAGDTDVNEFAGDASPSVPPERRQVVQAIIARNRKLVGKAKKDADYRCQRCDNESGWLTSEGKPYVEVHHIIPLGENGFDDLRNMIVLCVNCHKMLHHASNRHMLSADLREQRGLAQPSG